MRLSALAALMIVTTVVLSACAQQQMAALEDRSSQFFGRDEVGKGMRFMPPNPILTDGTPLQPRVISEETTQVAALDSVAVSDVPSAQPVLAAPVAPPAARGVQSFAAAPTGQTAPMMAQSAWQWPVNGKLVSDYAAQREGITIAATKGTPIRAALEGDVAYVGSQVKDYGNLVIVRHASGEMSAYSHASEIIVSKGDHVRQGDVLGYVGQTGRATQPQLHFAIRSGNHTIDPMTRLPSQMASYQ